MPKESALTAINSGKLTLADALGVALVVDDRLTPLQELFRANAVPLPVTIGDTDLEEDLEPLLSKPGSVGWHGKTVAIIAGVRCNVNIGIYVVDSKKKVIAERKAMGIVTE